MVTVVVTQQDPLAHQFQMGQQDVLVENLVVIMLLVKRVVTNNNTLLKHYYGTLRVSWLLQHTTQGSNKVSCINKKVSV